MENYLREYDAKLDAKKRITLRGVSFEYYHVQELADGSILLQPRVLSEPTRISRQTLNMMDRSVESLRTGGASAPIDLSEFED